MAERKIQEAPSDIGLSVSDRGINARASAGRAVATNYREAGEAFADIGRRTASTINYGAQLYDDAEKQETSRQISHGSTAASATLLNLDKGWNDTISKADPNDPSVSGKFMEQRVDAALEEFKKGFTTRGSQEYAESQANKIRSHFISKTTGDMAKMAGFAAVSNIDTLKNTLSAAAMSDPSSLRTSLDIVSHSVNSIVDANPNLDGIARARLKTETLEEVKGAIVKAAAVGAISKNPEAGLKQFSSPEYARYIGGTELKSLESQARTVQRAERADENYRRKNKELEEADISDKREGQYFEKLHSGDPKQAAEVSAKTIASDWNLTRAARQRMVGVVERETKPETAAKVSNQTATDLISRIRAPAGDPRRIDSLDPVYEAYEKEKLSKADLKFVRDEFVNIRTPEGAALGAQQEEFIKSVKPLIDKSNLLLGKIDASGPQQVYNFTMDLRRKVDEYRKAGKDPRDLMDPSKPESYMGGPAALVPYQKTLQQSLTDTARSLRPGPAIAPKPIEKGSIKDGYEFLGGSPGEAKNWRKVDGT